MKRSKTELKKFYERRVKEAAETILSRMAKNTKGMRFFFNRAFPEKQEFSFTVIHYSKKDSVLRKSKTKRVYSLIAEEIVG